MVQRRPHIAGERTWRATSGPTLIARRPEDDEDDPPPIAPPASRPKTGRPRAILIALGIVVPCVAVAAWLLRDPHTPRPIVETSLETSAIVKFLSGGREWTTLSFSLDSAERKDLAECLALAAEVAAADETDPSFSRPEVRVQLEKLLARRPAYFYAESLLGLWHQRTGDASHAVELFQQACDHAPVVLIQRYERADGRPLAGARIETFQVECNRVRNGELDPTLKLTFFDLVTDANGEIRVPVYDTVYRLFNTAHPDGGVATYPRLGWFKAATRTAVLPTVKVQPARTALR